MEFFVSQPLEIKNQEFGDECISCAVASIIEDTTKEIQDPKELYLKSKDSDFGQTPRKVLETAIELKLIKDFNSIWCFNYFTGIKRSILKHKKSVLTGCFWQPEWNKCEDGIVRGWYQNLEIFPHAFKVFGYKVIDNVEYLVVQNSTGISVGNKGIFYFPREIVNKFNFAYTLEL